MMYGAGVHTFTMSQWCAGQGGTYLRVVPPPHQLVLEGGVGGVCARPPQMCPPLREVHRKPKVRPPGATGGDRWRRMASQYER
eukprot:7636307-Pyramimonas_sp.AAC.1